MPTPAHEFLTRLGDHGIEYLFANSGTDFAPLIEALAERKGEAGSDPKAVVVPHETVAMGMAHGHYLASGKPQAVMVHTNVGLANAAMGAINAAADQVPILLASGRTPATEQGRLGSRSTPINWGQEMRDQAGMIREVVKWDGELRYPEQMADLIDRALAIAMSHPRGPAYLALPGETFCEAVEQEAVRRPVSRSARVAPDAEAIRRAADLLAEAANPLIIAHRDGGGDGVSALQRFAERHGIAVVEFWPSRNSLSSSSPVHQGYDPGGLLGQADVILVLDALVPWLPDRHRPADGARIIQAGPDPLHARYPVRGFACDVSLTGDAATVIAALDAAMGAPGAQSGERLGRLAEANATWRAAAKVRAEAGAVVPMRSDWVSRCLSDAIGPDGIVLSELGAQLGAMERPLAGTYFANPSSGGLGWALPAALGVKLARPDALVAACIGDGSYIFSNPPACHQVSEALNLPILTIVMNNGAWNVVRWATLGIYPQGEAARANEMPLTSLVPAPDYCILAQAHRAYAERVEDPHQLPAALERAIDAVMNRKTQALLEIRVSP